MAQAGGRLLLKVRVVHEKVDENVLYRTLECDPKMLTKDFIESLKTRLKDEQYNKSSDAVWGLFYPYTGVSGEGISDSMSSLEVASFHITSNSVRTASTEHSSNDPSSQRGGGASPWMRKRLSGCDEVGTWLDNDATLESHDLPQMAVLECRNAMRLFTITDLEDNLSKTMRVSNIDSVHNLLKEVSVRFSITNLDLYALQVIRDVHDHYWLNPEKRLSDQLMTADERMVLRQRYFAGGDLEVTDPYALHFMYLECREGVVKGDHPISINRALTFAALQMQITYRDYDPLIHVAGFLLIDEFLPPSYRTPPDSDTIDVAMYKGLLEEDIYKEHRKLKGLTETEAKRRYCKQLASFPTYGVSLVASKEKTNTSRHFDHDILIGIRFDSVLCLHPVSKEVFSTYHLHDMDDVTREGRKIRWLFREGQTPRDFELQDSKAATLFVDLFQAYCRLSLKGKGSLRSSGTRSRGSGGLINRKSSTEEDAIAQQLAHGLNLTSRTDESKSTLGF